MDQHAGMQPASPLDAWAGLADLTPAAKGAPWAELCDNIMFQPSPAGQLPGSCSWDALMRGDSQLEACDTPASIAAVVAAAAAPAAKSTHKKRVSWGSRMEHVQVVPGSEPSSATASVLGTGSAQDAESVGSASPKAAASTATAAESQASFYPSVMLLWTCRTTDILALFHDKTC